MRPRPRIGDVVCDTRMRPWVVRENEDDVVAERLGRTRTFGRDDLEEVDEGIFQEMVERGPR